MSTKCTSISLMNIVVKNTGTLEKLDLLVDDVQVFRIMGKT